MKSKATTDNYKMKDGVELKGQADMIVSDVIMIFRSIEEFPESPLANDILYLNACMWIFDKIEGIITFNGRMDITQGITYACEKNDIPYITLERTRDHGILLKPNENCLGLKEINRLNKIFINKPLKISKQFSL